MDQSKVMVVIPTYNEAENLPTLVGELLTLGIPGLEILFVDDNSPDGTGQVADDLAQQYPGRVHVLHRPGKMGLGTAYLTGFRYALDHGAALVVQMDADFSHSPEYLVQFVEGMGDCDVVIGSRYVAGGRLDERWSWWRYFLSWWANSVYTRLILACGSKIPRPGLSAGAGRPWRGSAWIGFAPTAMSSRWRWPI